MTSVPRDGDTKVLSSLERAAQQFSDDIRRDLGNNKLTWPSVPIGVVKIRRVLKDPEASPDDITRVA